MKPYKEIKDLFLEVVRNDDVNLDKVAKELGVTHAEAIPLVAKMKQDAAVLSLEMLRAIDSGKLEMGAMQRLGPILEQFGATADEASRVLKFVSQSES